MEDYTKLIRLYVPAPDFTEGEVFALSEDQAHYLRNVMRKSAGDRLRIFNGQAGDWLATLTDVSKNKAFFRLDKQIGEQQNSPDIWVIASPIKKEPFDLMIEKASELGAAKFVPVVCAHTVVHKINQERLQAIAVEAAEQCERGDVMQVEALIDLKKYLTSFSSDRQLIFCIERMDAPTLAETVRKLGHTKPLAILIGPEGGFTEAEADYVKSLPFVYPVTLGARVLRAETALIATLATIQLLS